jgi:hypothetical protein
MLYIKDEQTQLDYPSWSWGVAYVIYWEEIFVVD